MKYQWLSTSVPGIRYREHPSRKHGKKPDRYYVIRYQRNGKTIQEALGWASKDGITQTIANEQLIEIKRNIRRGEGPQGLKDKRDLEKIRLEAEQEARLKAERDNRTVSDLWNLYKVSNSEKKSLTREISIFKLHIKPVIGAKPLKIVATIHLERIKKNMSKDGLSPRSVHYAMSIIRQLFNYAKRFDYFDGENPVSKIKMPSFDNRRMRFFTFEESEALLKEILSKSRKTYNMTLLSLDSGLRAGEIFSLTWADVNIDDGIITIRDSKSGKTRFAYMTKRVKEMFRSLEAREPSQLVFPDRRGKKIIQMSNTFNRAVDKLKLNEGVNDDRFKVTFHTCRHSFASQMVISGVDLYAVKELLGHSDFKMTSRYAHLGQNTLQQAIQKMEQNQKRSNVVSMTKERKRRRKKKQKKG
jgi:integrase